MLPVKPYTIAVPANGSLQMQVSGRYLRVNACTNPVTVSIDGIGTLGAIGAGQGFKLPASVPPFARLMFTDASGAINNVTFIVADSEFVDNTVLGTVNVVDGGKARSVSGSAGAGVLTVAASAGNTSNVGLGNFNPGFNVLLKAYRISADSTTVVIAGFAGGFSGTNVGALPLKKSLSTSVAARAYTDVKVASNVTTRLDQVNVPAGSTVIVQLQEPYYLPYGNTLWFCPLILNCGISVAIEFVEEAAV